MPCTMPEPLSTDVAVIGGGIIGLGIALEAQRAGYQITLIDPAPATGATYAAAGMLAPVGELHYQEEELLDLSLASADRWPGFIQALASEGYPDTRFLSTPTLALGADAADRIALADMHKAQIRQGLEVSKLTLREARRLEPLLSPRITAAHMITEDHQVDPRAVAAAIEARLADNSRDSGRDVAATIIRTSATALLHEDPDDAGSRITGVLLADGRRVYACEVVVANGVGAASLGGMPPHLVLPLRPVHGDVLRLRVPEHLRPLVTSTVRGMVRGLPVYIVPAPTGQWSSAPRPARTRIPGSAPGECTSCCVTPRYLSPPSPNLN